MQINQDGDKEYVYLVRSHEWLQFIRQDSSDPMEAATKAFEAQAEGFDLKKGEIVEFSVAQYVFVYDLSQIIDLDDAEVMDRPVSDFAYMFESVEVASNAGMPELVDVINKELGE